MIDLWERPVEVANWLDLMSSVQHDHTPPSSPLFPDKNDAPPAPLTRVPHVIHHGQKGRRTTNKLWICSPTTTNISIFIMIQMQLRYQMKIAIIAGIPPKLPDTCSSVRQLQQQQQQLLSFLFL